MYLSSLHASLVASSTADEQERSQAQILLAVNTIHKGYEDGTRRTSALSQATVEDIDVDESDAWEGITSEIQRENVDRTVIHANRNFIKRWMFRVMLADVGESDEYGAEQEAPPTSVTQQPTSPLAETEDMYGAPERTASWVSSQSRPQTEYDVISSGVPDSSDHQPMERTPSFGSHRSKSSDWRPVAGPNADYVESLLARLLSSDETVEKNREHVTLIAKRMFCQLDFSGQGHLYHKSVEKRCWAAIQKSEVKLERAHLRRLIKAGDKDHNNKIDLHEFITFVRELLTAAQAAKEAGFRDAIEASNEEGLDYMSTYVQKRSTAALPWNSKRPTSSRATWMFATRRMTTLFRSDRPPHADLSTFANIELAANRCIDVLGAKRSQY
ncbi:hypothetical protein G647_01364 [Cladophialophora carrionii CBS 160.54]|uniref:EF-hand domain-containing protein n=1 Tax=Cladophialophora carrionii CBS 160.54 TaxID=1279043 RepID=V9DSJ3_9EURO|nr:uncharacterized protein G647_01364 [Cladophialophora carrionii CBS 160.54]ETI28912.1 hypothetical protein G647_01364 [Cladophialophora carrionii CBS 160.54]